LADKKKPATKKAPAKPAPKPKPRPEKRARAPLPPGVAVGIGAIALLLVFVALFYWQRGGSTFALTPNADQNVLVVTIDTLRADALSSYGGQAQTPNLDKLAAAGARFTFAHGHAVVTLPSHTSILTGRLPYEHGMRDNSGFRVKDGTATLATRLKPLGFATGAFVGGFPLTKRFGLTPGFDEYDDQIPEMKGEVSFAMPERRADAVVSRAVDWIDKQSGKFFSWVHVFDAHSPYRPPQEFATRYASQPYYGEVAWIDQALGPLFDRLASLARPTLVIVTADHGESLGEHGEITHGMFAYESTLRVPLIVAELGGGRKPGRGRVVDTAVRHVDIAPTVLAAVGADADSTMAGSSLLPLIESGSGPDRPAYFESMTYNLVRGWAPLRGVLVEKHKYIDLPVQELYNLASDAKEAKNVAKSDTAKTSVMLNTLKSYNMAPPDRPARPTAQENAALRALGYVTGSATPKTIYTEADDPKTLVEVDADLHRASDFVQEGRIPDAIALFTRVIERRPDTADAYISLAHAYWESGQVPQAIATLESALRNGSPDRDVRIRLGLYLAESHIDPARAIKVLEGLPTSDVEALNSLGIAYSDARRFADANAAFRKVLALDPTNGLAYQNLAYTALMQNKLPDAETFARQAIDADPSLAGAYTSLGVVMSQTSRKPDAIVAWKKAVELDPGDLNALYNLWLTLASTNQRDEAVKYGQQYLATAPPNFVQERAQITHYLNK
jgi:arylsulfatase A-like enzyme/Tfp pilus assembly protein PilF